MRRFSSLPNTLFNSLLQDFHGHFAKSALTNIFLDYVLHGGTFGYFFAVEKVTRKYTKNEVSYFFNTLLNLY
ncbi:MAG: hypothetical protein BWY22_00834 [Bacteroidetes bacterium ADurb.Bin217]|nr:MAG: hypothetical protein BWY22_00834 [Bacteroidetes bacterium ADurb.Bin217]